MSYESFVTKIGKQNVKFGDFLEGKTIISAKETKDGWLVDTDESEYVVEAKGLWLRKQLASGNLAPSSKITTWAGSPINKQMQDLEIETESNSAVKSTVNVDNEQKDKVLENQKLSKGGRKMEFKINDWTTPVRESIFKNLPEEYKTKEYLTLEDIDTIIETTSDNRTKKGLENVRTKLNQDYEAYLATKTDNTSTSTVNNSASESDVKNGILSETTTNGQVIEPPEETLNQSNLFNKSNGHSKNTRPKTEAEKEEARRKRDEKLQAQSAKHATLDAMLQRANEKLKEQSAFIKTITQLTTIMTKPFDGVVGVIAPVTSINTRLKAQVKNLITPDQRQYHPGAENVDKTKTGKDIEAKYAKGLYEVSLVESNPGTVSHFIIYMPEGLTVDHLTSLTTIGTATKIEELAKDVDNLKYNPVAVDKTVFTQLLTALHVPAYFITDKKKKDITQPYYVTDPRQSSSELFWWALKAYNKEGCVTKLACRGYIPLSTYVTTTLSLADKPALTTLIFGRTLTEISSYTGDTKFNQLTADSAAKFTGTPGNLVYTKFADSMTVPSYESTKSNPQTVSMKLPKTKMTEPSDEKPARPAFVKARYNELEYSAAFAAKTDLYKDVLATCRRPSKSSKQTELFRNAAYTEALLKLAQGGDISQTRIQ